MGAAVCPLDYSALFLDRRRSPGQSDRPPRGAAFVLGGKAFVGRAGRGAQDRAAGSGRGLSGIDPGVGLLSAGACGACSCPVATDVSGPRWPPGRKAAIDARLPSFYSAPPLLPRPGKKPAIEEPIVYPVDGNPGRRLSGCPFYRLPAQPLCSGAIASKFHPYRSAPVRWPRHHRLLA